MENNTKLFQEVCKQIVVALLVLGPISGHIGYHLGIV